MLGLIKFGFHEFQYKGAKLSKKNYQHNYTTETLSSNSSQVAGISQVMKHIMKNRPQMVSITKLYSTLRKKLLFVSVLPIEKARSYPMTLGITEIILTGFKNSMPYFSPGNKFLNFNSYLTVVGNAVILPCIQQQIKGEQSDEIRHSSFISSTPHEVKSTDMHCILTTNINKCLGENTTRRKNAISSPRQCIPATKPAYLQKVDSKSEA